MYGFPCMSEDTLQAQCFLCSKILADNLVKAAHRRSSSKHSGVLDSDSFSSKPLQFYQVRRIDWRVWSKTLEEVSSVTTCETKAKLSCWKTHSLCVWLKLLQQCRIHPWTYFALLVTSRSCQSPFFIRENVWKVWMCCRQWQSTHRCVKKMNPDIKWMLCIIHHQTFTSKTQTVKCCFIWCSLQWLSLEIFVMTATHLAKKHHDDPQDFWENILWTDERTL